MVYLRQPHRARVHVHVLHAQLAQDSGAQDREDGDHVDAVVADGYVDVVYMFNVVMYMLRMIMYFSFPVVGVGICVIVYMAKARGDPCQMTTQNWILCASIYGSYFVLFANFFYQAYLAPKTEKITSNGVEKSKKTVVQNGANGDAPRSAKKVQ